VVPLRFGAIYRSRDQVGGMLDERADEFRAAIGRIRGHVEFGVKAWVDVAVLERTISPAERSAAAGEGAAYLQRRRQEQERSREVAALGVELAETAHQRLSAVADSAVANRPQPRELTGRPEPMLLNGAYLVREGDDRLRNEVERLAEEHSGLGVEYELTGPWPAHNFAEDPA
jgi:hypothetical protein